MIITKEHGLTKNENPLQGAFIIEELTDLVEEAVLQEFERLNDRGGVLGAMETQYQRGKIQEESMLLRNEETFRGTADYRRQHVPEPESAVRRGHRQYGNCPCNEEEKETQITNLRAFQSKHNDATAAALRKLQEVAVSGGNIFAELMETVKVASLGQITNALYEVGGQYRRNM